MLAFDLEGTARTTMLTPGQLDLLKLQLYLHRGGDLGRLAQGRLEKIYY